MMYGEDSNLIYHCLPIRLLFPFSAPSSLAFFLSLEHSSSFSASDGTAAGARRKAGAIFLTCLLTALSLQITECELGLYLPSEQSPGNAFDSSRGLKGNLIPSRSAAQVRHALLTSPRRPPQEIIKIDGATIINTVHVVLRTNSIRRQRVSKEQSDRMR